MWLSPKRLDLKDLRKIYNCTAYEFNSLKFVSKFYHV